MELIALNTGTEDVVAVRCIIDDEPVMLVDTPGFSDTNISDTEILARIARWWKTPMTMGACYRELYISIVSSIHGW